MKQFPFIFNSSYLTKVAEQFHTKFESSTPFPNVVIDDFLPREHAVFFSNNFPKPDDVIWRVSDSIYQPGKQGIGGDTNRISQLSIDMQLALQEFNSFRFLSFLEQLTGFKGLMPDPYFRGGALHQIPYGGFLNIHTDFNQHHDLRVYRKLNVLIYLTESWEQGIGGELELWRDPDKDESPAHIIPPIFNRMVVFQTDKSSFHGHPNKWVSNNVTRRSIALYYYTADKQEGMRYDGKTDWKVRT